MMYKDTRGVWTIGIGYNIQDRGLPIDICEELFRRDMASLRAEASRIPEYAALDAVRRGVIERMVFQLGLHGVLEFKNTRRYLAAGDWQAASVEMLDSDWAEQTPARARRESQRILTGVE